MLKAEVTHDSCEHLECACHPECPFPVWSYYFCPLPCQSEISHASHPFSPACAEHTEPFDIREVGIILICECLDSENGSAQVGGFHTASHQQCTVVAIAPHLFHHLLFTVFFPPFFGIIIIIMAIRRYFTEVGFEDLFMCLWAICKSSLEKYF